MAVSGVAGDFAICAAEIQQRLSFVHFRVLHFSDKDGVVAGQMRGNQLATHLEKSAIDDVSAAGRPPEMDAQPLFRCEAVFAFCEVFGDGLLILFQDADAEQFFPLKQRMHFRALIHADQHQHGIERDGGEGVGGHAVDFAGLALDGDDGDAGGEMTEGFAEFG